MPKAGPIKHRDLIRYLRKLGWEGPYAGGKHEYMVKGQKRLALPNPHQREISQALLAKVLQQAGVSTTDWEKL